MTIDEAISEKQRYHEKYRAGMLSKEREADQMSIEALKEVIWLRSCQAWNAHRLLPGETEE